MKLKKECKLLFFLLAASCLVSPQARAAQALTQTNDNWAKIEKTGTDALNANEFWIAEPALLSALQKAEKFGPHDIRLAKSLESVGELYTIRGRFDEAEAYLEESLAMKRQAWGPDDNQLIPSMGSLVKFYLNYGTAPKADPLAEEMLAMIEGKWRDPALHSRNKKVHFKKGQAFEAWAGVADVHMRDPAIDWAITCDELGTMYRMRGNYDLSFRLFKAALDIRSTIFGSKHMALANSYDNLGTLYLVQKKYAEAEPYYKDSLAIAEKILEPEDHEVYNRMDKLARCEIKLGNYRQAEDLYLNAQHLWDKEPSRYDDPTRAAFALGSLYAEEKNYAAAGPVLNKALRMAEETYGPCSASLMPYLQKRAYVSYYEGHKPEMEKLHERADTIAGESAQKSTVTH